MSKTIFDIAISLDGFMAGEHGGPENPIGDGGLSLHQWMFVQKAFWEHLGKTDGTEDGRDGQLIRDAVANVGAYIMGKRMFEEGAANWPEDLFKADVFVLTHEKRAPWIQKGSTTFYFINDGMESAFEKATISAKGRDIRIQGGATTIQQFLNAGLVNECFIHISPVLLGSGLRLFDHLQKDRYDVEIMEVIPSPLTTHLRYKFRRKS